MQCQNYVLAIKTERRTSLALRARPCLMTVSLYGCAPGQNVYSANVRRNITRNDVIITRRLVYCLRGSNPFCQQPAVSGYTSLVHSTVHWLIAVSASCTTREFTSASAILCVGKTMFIRGGGEGDGNTNIAVTEFIISITRAQHWLLNVLVVHWSAVVDKNKTITIRGLLVADCGLRGH